MDVTVNMEVITGPVEVQLAAGQAGVEILPGAVTVRGPGVFHIGEGNMGVTLSLTPSEPRHPHRFVTVNDSIRSLIEANRDYERWERDVVQLAVALDAAEECLEVERRVALADVEMDGAADSIAYLDHMAECEAYQDALAVVTATRDAMTRAEAEVRIAQQAIQAWDAVSRLLARDA